MSLFNKLFFIEYKKKNVYLSPNNVLPSLDLFQLSQNPHDPTFSYIYEYIWSIELEPRQSEPNKFKLWLHNKACVLGHVCALIRARMNGVWTAPRTRVVYIYSNFGAQLASFRSIKIKFSVIAGGDLPNRVWFTLGLPQLVRYLPRISTFSPCYMFRAFRDSNKGGKVGFANILDGSHFKSRNPVQ